MYLFKSKFHLCILNLQNTLSCDLGLLLGQVNFWQHGSCSFPVTMVAHVRQQRPLEPWWYYMLGLLQPGEESGRRTKKLHFHVISSNLFLD